MARGIIARTGTAFVLALLTLAACDRTLATEASFARGGNGNGKGAGATQDPPTMAISPTEMTLGVGQEATVTVTYWDRHGDIIPVTVAKMTYYGCLKVLDTDPDCSSIVSIAPGGTNNREATVTGKAPGSVRVYAADGFGTWVMSLVTVQ